jgi:hypothetical protein
MSARDDIAAHFTSDSLAAALLDRHRAEVLREAVRTLRAKERTMPEAGRREYGPGVLVAALVLDELADEAPRDELAEAVAQMGALPVPLGHTAPAAPDFFQPGRTYAYDADGFTAPELITVFRVASTTTHPATGEPFAFGWIRKGETTTWQPYAEPGTEWPDAWTEITEESTR